MQLAVAEDNARFERTIGPRVVNGAINGAVGLATFNLLKF